MYVRDATEAGRGRIARVNRVSYTFRMQRPREGREETAIERARRVQIVAGTRDVVAEVGYHQASMARIAERVGITKGVISYHFGNKDGLIDAVLREIIHQGAEFVGDRLQRCTSWREGIRVYIGASIEYLVGHPTSVRAILSILQNARPLPSLADTEVAQAEPFLAGMLRRGQEAGEFGAFCPETVAMLVRNNLDHLPWRMSENPAFDVLAHRDQLITLVEKMILPGPD